MSRVSKKSRPIFTEYRFRKIDSNHPIASTTEKTKNMVGIWSAIIVVLVTFSIGVRSLESTGVWISPGTFSGEFVLLVYTVPFFYYIGATLWVYRRWRLSWEEFWKIIRMLSAPEGIVLDSLGCVGQSLHASIRSEEGAEPIQYAKELIKRYNLHSLNASDSCHMEYANWYHTTYCKIKGIKAIQFEKHEYLKKFREEFENLGDEFPTGRFTELIRRSVILDAENLMRVLPRAFDSAAELFYNEIDSEYRSGTFEQSIDQLDYIRNLSSVPIPSNVSWLLGFFIFALSILPYALSVGLIQFIP